MQELLCICLGQEIREDHLSPTDRRRKLPGKVVRYRVPVSYPVSVLMRSKAGDRNRIVPGHMEFFLPRRHIFPSILFTVQVFTSENGTLWRKRLKTFLFLLTDLDPAFYPPDPGMHGIPLLVQFMLIFLVWLGIDLITGKDAVLIDLDRAFLIRALPLACPAVFLDSFLDLVLLIDGLLDALDLLLHGIDLILDILDIVLAVALLGVQYPGHSLFHDVPIV